MKLIILGNGFDRNYNLKTDYVKDYKPILKKLDPIFFEKLNKLYFDGNEDYWYRFEDEIGKNKNVNFLLDNIKKSVMELYNTTINFPDIGSESFGANYEAVDDALYEAENKKIDLKDTFIEEHDDFFERLHSYLEEGFRELARQVNSNLRKQAPQGEFNFSQSSYFLTFNYTDTLEVIYPYIPSAHICHIHGSASQNDSLIFGTDDTKDEYLDFYLENEIYPVGTGVVPDLPNFLEFVESVNYSQVAIDELNNISAEKIDSLNEQMKKVLKLTELDNFLTGKDIFEIYVYGLSVGKVDLPYLEEIHRSYPNASWTISYYEFGTQDDPVKRNIAQLSFFNKIKLEKSTDFKRREY